MTTADEELIAFANTKAAWLAHMSMGAALVE
jgi:hypothetical protein